MSDAESSHSKKIKGPQCREGGHHDLIGNGFDRHQRDLSENMQISGSITESLMVLPCLSLQGFSGVLLSRCQSLSSGNM